jgi:molybdenum cofactor cytidylyltransferase
MTAIPHIGCALLAAGASHRLGRPKQLVSVGDEPLVRRMARIARAAQVDALAVIVGAHAAELRATLVGLDLDCVDNHRWAEGMSTSLRAATDWAKARRLDALLVAVVDQVRLTTEHLDVLIAASRGGSLVVASRYQGVLGVPALFPRHLFPALAALRGDVGARELLRAREGAGHAAANDELVAVPWEGGAVDLDLAGDLDASFPPTFL